MAFGDKLKGLADSAKKIASDSVGTIKNSVNKVDNSSDLKQENTIKEDFIPDVILTVIREKQFFAINPSLKIILDDSREFSIENGQQLDIPMKFGKCGITFSLMRKKRLELNLTSNTTVKLHFDRLSGNIEAEAINEQGKINGSDLSGGQDKLSEVSGKLAGKIRGDGQKSGNRPGVLFEIFGTNGQLFVYDNKVVIERKGLLGFVSQGMAGSKTIPFSAIQSIQTKEAKGITNGFIQFGVLGGNEAKGGLFSATEDENTIMTSDNEMIIKIKDFIEDKIYNKPQNNGTVIQQLSSADELLKFKSLLDAGVITQEEFDLKKKQLLGL